MFRRKTFCLKCYKTNACSCGTNKYFIPLSYKLRPPKTYHNKLNNKKWNDFLDKCPQFINCVPEELFEDFNIFLKKINFKKDNINGFKIPLKEIKFK